MTEEFPTRPTERFQIAADTHSPAFLGGATVDIQDLEAWRATPDVHEGDIGELAAPFHGYTDTTARRHDGVTQALPTVKATEGELPDTINTSDVFGLGQHIFEGALKMVVNIIRISVN